MNKSSIILFCFVSQFMLGLIDNLRGPALPFIIQDFKISQTSASLFYSISSFAGVLVNLAIDKYAKRFNLSYFPALCYGLLSFSCLFFTYAAHINVYWIMLVGAFILGLSFGFIGFSDGHFINQSVSTLEKRKYYSLMYSMYGLSSIVGPFLFAQVHLPWWAFFTGTGILSLILIFFSNPVKFSSLTLEQSGAIKQKIKFSHKIIFGLILSSYVSAEIVVSSRMNTFLISYHHMTSKMASNYLLIFFLLLLIGRFSFSFIHFKKSETFILITKAILSVVFIILGLYINPLFLALSGLTMSAFYPTVMSWTMSIFHNSSAEIISSSLYLTGIFLVIMNFIFGHIADNYGLMPAMHLSVLFLLVDILLIFYIKKIKVS